LFQGIDYFSKGKKMGWYDNRDGMMNGNGYTLIGILVMILFLLVLGWILIRAFDHKSQQHGHHDGGHHPHPHQPSEALAHLDMRLAKGEISGEEYAAIKEHLKR
jgi:uncharacterized membrane protein